MATIDKDIYRALTEVRPLPITYTVDDLEFMPEDTNRYELIGGELFVSRAPHLDHQLLATNLIGVFVKYLETRPVGIIVTTPGIIFDDKNAVIPDLVFATNETVAKNVAGKDEKFDGKFVAAPELIIEIVSMGKKDIERDRIHKRKLYGDFGVKEYWVVEGFFNTIEVYRLKENEQQLIKRFELHESIETPLLADFSLKLSDIFRS
jgi:Uma2 family endonuclease